MTGQGGPSADLFVTEGATKAYVANHLSGVWVFAVAGQALLPEHIAAIRGLRPGRVIVALDQEHKPQHRARYGALAQALHGANLSACVAV